MLTNIYLNSIEQQESIPVPSMKVNGAFYDGNQLYAVLDHNKPVQYTSAMFSPIFVPSLNYSAYEVIQVLTATGNHVGFLILTA